MKNSLYFFIFFICNLIYAQSDAYSFSSSGLVTNNGVDNLGQSFTATSISGGVSLMEGFLYLFDISAPTVTLTDTDADNVVSNSSVVTITATFSESMAATPTLSLSGIISNAEMTATSSASIWTYTWTVSSTTVTSTTATISGTDLSGNALAGVHSSTFIINILPLFNYEFDGNLLNTGLSSNGDGTNTSTIYTPTFGKDRYGNSNESLSMSTTQYMVLNPLMQLSTSTSNGISLAGWIYIEPNISVGSYRYIIDLTDGTANNNWNSRILVALTSSFTLKLGTNHNGILNGSDDYSVESLTVNQGEWIHFVGVWDLQNDALAIYINGVQSGSVTDISNISILDISGGSSGSKHIGQRVFSSSISSNWIGEIDDVKFYDIALTNAKVLELYQSEYQLTVSLTDTDADNIVSNSDVVTITATFSESMAATPTLSLSGIISNASMSATASDSVWTYTWTVSGSTVSSTTATVSGTDLVGNVYSGTDSITFTIDRSAPTIIDTSSSDDDDIVKGGNIVRLSATFSEAVVTPSITIGSLVPSTSMTVSASTDSKTWYYDWTVPFVDGVYVATVSTTDLLGNAYSGSDSVTLTVDNTDPEISSVSINDDNDTIKLTFTEPTFIADATSNSYTTTDTTYYLSVNQSGGTATITVDQIRYDSTTDERVYYLDITVNGTSDGSEQISIAPFSASRFKDRVGNFAATSQTSNTITLNNTPPKFVSTTVNSANTSITIEFSEEVKADAGFYTSLTKEDFVLNITGGVAALSSTTPLSLTVVSDKKFVLEAYYTTPANGSELLTVSSQSSSVFDSKGDEIDYTQTQSNTVVLNDVQGPLITGTTLDSQNRYVDITFNEGVFGYGSAAAPVSVYNFILTQTTGASYSLTVSSVTTVAGAALVGGETTLRLNLDGGGIKPTGQEVFSITADASSTLIDANGNAMSLIQTNNTFQLKPPTSGGVSPLNSTLIVAPATMIANGVNGATLVVQAKDSLGQNFFEGGYNIKIFSPEGDLTTVDNQNGTYTASYIPTILNQASKEITFGYRVADTQGSATAILTLHRDEDGDGVYDINDDCPGTEPNTLVDENGCALNQLDSDNDGVFDDVDECPDTPETELNNVKGTPTYGTQIPTVVDEKGCGASQRDTDGDGIFDTEDNCIDTANPDQADADGDGIGDVCDTDNPLPEITTTEITFVQLPQNGTPVGKIEAIDPDGEALIFTQTGNNFTGVLSIATDGTVTVNSGALLTFDSTYNGASLSFTVSDGENEVTGSVKIVIDDAPRPPEISIITFEISEDAEVGTPVGFVEVKDPMGGQIVSINLQGDGFIELVDGVLKTTQELDYETITSHPFTIFAQASDRTDGPGLSATKAESIRVSDIPNATYTGRFFISIFNVEDENLGAKVDHRRYYNPHNDKNVGKWKIKKKITGGADADKFTIKSASKETLQKGLPPIEDENEDYLDFITPPDFENPGDANKDNIYEVEVEYLNTNDGAPEVPVVVTQTNIQVPEGATSAIELQSKPVLATDDSDGDGVVDIIDNSPLVSNPDQADEDGDGVGDVSDDADHDGVWNPFDSCPDTPLGELVDLEGCLIYYLPANNFSISKTEKCAGANSILLSVVDSTITYKVEVSGAVNRTETFSGSSWSLDQLSAGAYTLCITVEGVSALEFERCFELTIEEPQPLAVSSLFDKQNQTVSFAMSGGKSYDITVNGKTTQTSKSNYTVSLEKGINQISISTGIECQGWFQNTYLNSYEVKYAPNPFNEQLQLYIGGADNIVEIGVYTTNGQLIEYQTVNLPFGVRTYTIDTGEYKQGVYIVKVTAATLDQSIQVIKE